MERREYLERVIMGLEMSIPDFRSRLQYYKDGDLEKKYAEKFLASMEENLAKYKSELAELPAEGADDE
jgi:exonuclease VII small subunit